MIRKLFTGPRVLRNRINQIIDAVERLSTITGDGFIKVNKTNSGVSLGLNVEKLRPRVWNRRQKTPLSGYLIAKWLFNGNFKDTSGKDNDLTNYGGILKDNYCVYPADDYSRAGSGLIPLSSDFTVTGWFRTSDSTSQALLSQYILGNAGRLIIYATYSTVSNKARVFFDGGTLLLSTEEDLHDGNWHWLAIKRKGSLWDMYLDGVHTGSQANTSQEINDFNTQVSGYLAVASPMLGEVDDIRIYSKGLEDCELRQVYEEGLKDRSFVSGKVFVVVSAATGDGVYNCYEQTLDATDWDDTAGNDKFDHKNTDSIEVFNLLENDPIADYSPALTVGDAIKAWQWIDDEGNKRWAGIPLVTNPVRRAITTQAAPALAHITANLYNHAGVEITEGLGSGITVYCDIIGGTKLSEAIPQLKDNTPLSTLNIQGKWYCTSIFQTYDTNHFQVSGDKLQDKLDPCP